MRLSSVKVGGDPQIVRSVVEKEARSMTMSIGPGPSALRTAQRSSPVLQNSCPPSCHFLYLAHVKQVCALFSS